MPTTGHLARLAVAGLVAPILFAILVIVQGLLQPDYSHVALPVSALAAWPLGWIQDLNFVAFGLLTLSLWIGVARALRARGVALVGPGLLAVSSLGFLVVAASPWREVDGALIETHTHVVGFFMCFLGAGLGFMFLGQHLEQHWRWQNLAQYTWWSGVGCLALLMVFGTFAITPGTPLNPWAGLIQRAMVLVWFTCTFVLSRRLLRVARTSP